MALGDDATGQLVDLSYWSLVLSASASLARARTSSRSTVRRLLPVRAAISL